MKKIGMLLAGCGVYDGSELHESVLVLLALERAGAQIVNMAPNMELDVIDHLTQKPTGQKRNSLQESARVVPHTEIKDIKDVSGRDIDGLIIPGGFGIKNLSSLNEKQEETKVRPEVQKLLDDLVHANKPIGAVCAAPFTLVKALASKKIQITVGNDPKQAAIIEAAGGNHYNCTVRDIHIDEKNNIITTPGYMIGNASIGDVADGINKMVSEIIRRA
jgi:enhancing lycopene biosynthesis protein 2